MTCHVFNEATRTVKVQKDWVNGVLNDQFTLNLGGDATGVTEETSKYLGTDGIDTTKVTTGTVKVLDKFTAGETPGGSNQANYDTTTVCKAGATILDKDGQGKYTAPAAPATSSAPSPTSGPPAR